MLIHILSAIASLTAVKVVIDFLFLRPEIQAALDRDPAAKDPLSVVLLYPGFHAIEAYFIAHALWRAGVPFFPRLISQGARFLTGVEIHPGASLGRGLFIDHGMGVVIGETAVVGKNVTLYQQVTLGGTGKEKGKRHPTIGNQVVIGGGAKVLGNIHIGDNVFIGANAVVIRDVPAASTVVGVPGRVASRDGQRVTAASLDHAHLPDPIARSLIKLHHEIQHIEREIREFHSGEPKKPTGTSEDS